MAVTVIIPVKSFTSGKGRLAGVIDPETRGRLSRALANHVATTVTATGRAPVVVTEDADVAQWAGDRGYTVLDDSGDGLSAAAGVGVARSVARSDPWLILHSDLPWLTADDVEAVAGPVESGGSVLAPSADGGTSAIGAHGPLPLRFGPSSFHHHLAALSDASIVARPGLLLDVDNPADLRAARESARGAWLTEALLSPA